MSRLSVLKIGLLLFSFVLYFFLVKNKTDRTSSAENKMYISISNNYILIDDKSFLTENFKKGFLDAHTKKLKIISPEKTYRVTIGIGKQTKIDKILMVKKILKESNINKLDIKIR